MWRSLQYEKQLRGAFWLLHRPPFLTIYSANLNDSRTYYLPIHQIHRKHAQMLVKELDVPIVNPLGNLLADLVRAPPLNHVETGPAILRLSARGSADEEVVLHPALEAILLDVVGQGGRDLLRIADASEAAPSNVGAVGEMVQQVLCLGQLLQVARPPHTALE